MKLSTALYLATSFLFAGLLVFQTFLSPDRGNFLSRLVQLMSRSNTLLVVSPLPSLPCEQSFKGKTQSLTAAHRAQTRSVATR